MKAKYLMFVVVLLLVSCMSTKELMDSWMGKHKKDLVLKWGLPAKRGSDENGGEIFLYSKKVYIPASTFHDGHGGSSTRPSKTYWEYKMFYVNADGIIYSWKTFNEQVPPIQIDLNIYIIK